MKIMLLIIAMMFSACATGSIEVVKPNGDICRASYYSLFKDMSEFKVSACRAKADIGSSTVSMDEMVKLYEALKPFFGSYQ